MAYALDTSGTVHAVPGGPAKQGTHHPVDLDWCDLSPFVQGYVEALFADEGGVLSLLLERYAHEGVQVRFDDLAPETLARIVADCEAAAPAEPRAYNADALRKMGADLWRRSGKTVQIGDDGKVRFAEAQKEA